MSRGRLAPLSEHPTYEQVRSSSTWRHWLTNRLFHHVKQSDLRILLSVMACPLFPVPHPITPRLQVSSSAEYIIQQFRAATGCNKLEAAGMVKSMYATGRVAMAMVDHHEINISGGSAGEGCFVLWQMVPNKWLIELVVGGHKVMAGCDGNVAWRHTPWFGAHPAKGGVRPLRRPLQGLDPIAISWMFSTAEYVGEKKVSGMDCFVLKLSTEHGELSDRSDGSAEILQHVTLGYFSQRTGLLLHLEDSYLTRIQAEAGPGSHPTYWETTMRTKVEDYRPAAGVMTLFAHTGHSSVSITRFGEAELRSIVMRMDEIYVIDDLAFNVAGLSADSFIPPQEMGYISSSTTTSCYHLHHHK